MYSVKEEVINMVGKLPNNISIEDIMYELYVLDKVKKGQVDFEKGKCTNIDGLRKEIETW